MKKVLLTCAATAVLAVAPMVSAQAQTTPSATDAEVSASTTAVPSFDHQVGEYSKNHWRIDYYRIAAGQKPRLLTLVDPERKEIQALSPGCKFEAKAVVGAVTTDAIAETAKMAVDTRTACMNHAFDEVRQRHLSPYNIRAQVDPKPDSKGE